MWTYDELGRWNVDTVDASQPHPHGLQLDSTEVQPGIYLCCSITLVGTERRLRVQGMPG